MEVHYRCKELIEEPCTLKDAEELINFIFTKTKNLKIHKDLVKKLDSKVEKCTKFLEKFKKFCFQKEEVLFKKKDQEFKKFSQEAEQMLIKGEKDLKISLKQELNSLKNLEDQRNWATFAYHKLSQRMGAQELKEKGYQDYLVLKPHLSEDLCMDMLNQLNCSKDRLLAPVDALFKSIQRVNWSFNCEKDLQNAIISKAVHRLDNLKTQAEQLEIEKYDPEENYKRLCEAFELMKGWRDRMFQYFSAEKIAKSLRDLQKAQEVLTGIQETLNNSEAEASSLEFKRLKEVGVVIDTLMKIEKEIQEPGKKLELTKARVLKAKAEEVGAPKEVPMLKKLAEDIERTENFHKSYSEYKKYKEKKASGNLKNLQTNPEKFTKEYLKNLLAESMNLQLDLSDSDYFDADEISQDLEKFETWRSQAETVVETLQKDRKEFDSQELRREFFELREEKFDICVHDHEINIQFQHLKWLFEAHSLMNPEDESKKEQLPVWISKLEQVKELKQYSKLQDHPFYQNFLFQISQAKEIKELVNQASAQKQIMERKYTLKAINFKQKQTLKQFEAQLLRAEASKISLKGELGFFRRNIEEYTKNSSLFDEDKLLKDYKLMLNIMRTIYVSPIDYDRIDEEVRNKVESLDESLAQLRQDMESSKKHLRRIRLSKVEDSVREYLEEEIKGIEEFDQMIEKIKRSREALKVFKDKVQELSEQEDCDIMAKVPELKMLQSKIEIDLEEEEKEAKEIFWLLQMEAITDMDPSEQKIDYESFTQLVKDSLHMKINSRNEEIINEFNELKGKVAATISRLHKMKNKTELNELKEIASKSLQISFTQEFIDKETFFVIGEKRKAPEPEEPNKKKKKQVLSLKTQKQQAADLRLDQNRQKEILPDAQSSQSSSEESGSESSSSGSGSSSSGSGSSSSSSSSSGDSKSSAKSSPSKKSGKEESEEDEQEENLANQRPKRLKKMKFKEDFIYDKVKLPTYDRKNSEDYEEEEKKPKSKKDKRKKKQRKVSDSSSSMSSSDDDNKVMGIKTSSNKKKRAPPKPSEMTLEQKLEMMKLNEIEQSKKRILKALLLLNHEEQKAQEQAEQFQQQIQQRFPQINQQYKNVVEDLVANLKSLEKFPQVSKEIFLKKKSYLFKNQGNFQMLKEEMIKELRKRHEDEAKIEKLTTKQKLAVPSELETEKEKKLKQQDSSSDDSFGSSDGEGAAAFSDEETKKNTQQFFDASRADEMQQTLAQIREQKRQKMPFNPKEALRQADEYQKIHYSNPQPLLFDPFRTKLLKKYKKEQNLTQNKAPVGSILKVWEGQINNMKDAFAPTATLYSTNDINLFQRLPEFPTQLNLKDKIKFKELKVYFDTLVGSKKNKFLTGWLVRQNQLQINCDFYSKVFDDLEQGQKVAVFEVMPNVNLYLVPMFSLTRNFCQAMRIKKVPLHEENSDEQTGIDTEIEEFDPHTFAWICKVTEGDLRPKKEPFNQKGGSKVYLNPTVVREIDEIKVVRPDGKKDQNDGDFSEISSEEENANQNFQPLLRPPPQKQEQRVKTEQMDVEQHHYEPLQQPKREEMITDPNSAGFHLETLLRQFDERQVPLDQIKAILTKVVQSGKLNEQEKQTMRSYITNLIEQDKQRQQQQQQIQPEAQGYYQGRQMKQEFPQGQQQQYPYYQQQQKQQNMAQYPNYYPGQQQQQMQGMAQFGNQNPALAQQWQNLPPQLRQQLLQQQQQQNQGSGNSGVPGLRPPPGYQGGRGR